jgi:6-phosphogluconolactonase (cycloisomerase 2 family)
MKFSQIRRITQATVLSLAIGLGMTACSSDYTIDFLYVTTSRALPGGGSDGGISAYKVDNQSGALTQIVDSPYDSGGVSPGDIVLSPNNQALYVLNNQSSNIEEFLIGTDGKIYPEFTYTMNVSTTGSFPVSAVVDPTGSFLVVAFTYQHAFTTLSPGPGGVMVFPIAGGSSLCPSTGSTGSQPTNSLCAPILVAGVPYTAVAFNPVAVGVTPNPSNCPVTGGSVSSSCPLNGGNYVPYIYVVEQTVITGTAPTSTAGTILTYKLSLTNGSLTFVASAAAGVGPFGIAEDPLAHFVYLTDENANQIIGYIVQPNGSLTAMVNGPFSAGLFPEGIVADPRDKFIYVTNYNNSTVNGYAIDSATGTPSGVASNGVTAVGTGPKCITIEPSRGMYLYTANFVDNSVSGLQLDPHSGALTNIQDTPFNAAGNPTCATAVTAGAHAFEALPQ